MIKMFKIAIRIALFNNIIKDSLKTKDYRYPAVFLSEKVGVASSIRKPVVHVYAKLLRKKRAATLFT